MSLLMYRMGSRRPGSCHRSYYRDSDINYVLGSRGKDDGLKQSSGSWDEMDGNGLGLMGLLS